MFVTVNGARLYFDVDGEGLTSDSQAMRQKPTIVMVHGGPGADHTVYKPYFSQLSDIAQVVYYDHRGNGRSAGNDPKDWTLSQWGDDLKALCDTLGIEKPIVIGTSFGGFVALSYATRYPDHMGALALISTAARVDFPAIYEAFERIGGPRARAIAQSYWEAPTDEGRALYRDACVPLYKVIDARDDWLHRVLWRNETALHFNGPRGEHGQFDFTPSLAKITCPTLVMVGEKDPITPAVFSDTIVAGLRDDIVTYRKYPDCGHGVVTDKPDEALAELRALVSAITS